MIVTVSRTITWTVTEFFKAQDFIVPDEMAQSSNEEIIAYLDKSNQLDKASWDMADDNWSDSRYEFSIDEREQPDDDDSYEYEEDG
jgi:hypothetical protein